MPTAESDRRAIDEEAAGVYVHIPFCARICPYCDFAVTVGDAAARRRLVEAVRTETARVGPSFGRSVDTIYLGGGTPSLLLPEEVGRIVGAIEEHLEVGAGTRIFLEANPEDVDEGRLDGWRELGVTTLSLGVQALDDAALDFLGRRHTAGEARGAIVRALEAGFETVSIDLIYARPGQTVAGWRAELDAAVALGVDHLSCYQLTVEPATPFGRRAARGDLSRVSEDLEVALFFATHEHLEAAGFDGYEVSNFARAPVHRSRHNLKYWRRMPYLGLGPSAHSFADERRWWNVRGSRDYVERIEAGESPVDGWEDLTSSQRSLERLMLGLRSREGVELGVVGDDVAESLREWQECGWVVLEGSRLVPTMIGMALAERLAAELDLDVDPPRPSALT